MNEQNCPEPLGLPITASASDDGRQIIITTEEYILCLDLQSAAILGARLCALVRSQVNLNEMQYFIRHSQEGRPDA